MSIVCLLSIIFLTPEISQAEGGFALLENYPGLEKVQEAVINGDSSEALGTYIDWIVKFSLGLLSIGAVIALIVAGIQYIGSETWSKKSDAKDLIVRSIGALVLMFSAFIFFEQLNPELLKVRFKPVNVSSKKPIIFNGVIDNAFTDFADFNTDSKSTILEKDGWNENECWRWTVLLPGPDRDDKIKKCGIKKAQSDNNGKYKTECVAENGVVCLYRILKKVYNDPKYTKSFANLKYKVNKLNFKWNPTNEYFGDKDYNTSKNTCDEERGKINKKNIYKNSCYCVPIDGSTNTECGYFILNDNTQKLQIKNERPLHKSTKPHPSGKITLI